MDTQFTEEESTDEPLCRDTAVNRWKESVESCAQSSLKGHHQSLGRVDETEEEKQ